MKEELIKLKFKKMKKITLVYFNILAVLSVICQPTFAQTSNRRYFSRGDSFYLESGGL